MFYKELLFIIRKIKMTRKLMVLCIILVLMCFVTACGESYAFERAIKFDKKCAAGKIFKSVQLNKEIENLTADDKKAFETALDAYNYGAAYYKNALKNDDSYRHVQIGKGSASIVGEINIQLYKLAYKNEIFKEDIRYNGSMFGKSVKSAEQTIVTSDKNGQSRKSNSVEKGNKEILTVKQSNWSKPVNVNCKDGSYRENIFAICDYELTVNTVKNITGFNYNDAVKKGYYEYTFDCAETAYGNFYKNSMGDSEHKGFGKSGYLKITIKQDLFGKITHMHIEEKFDAKSGIINATITNILDDYIKYNVTKPNGIGFGNYNWFKDFSNV